jgi:hypothetical protein
MKANVGSSDKIIRIIAGVAAIGAGFYFQSWWGAVGVVPLGTGLLNFCPLYAMLGINTCKAQKAP